MYILPFAKENQARCTLSQVAICQLDLLKLLLGFVKVVLCISYPLPKKTKHDAPIHKLQFAHLTCAMSLKCHSSWCNSTKDILQHFLCACILLLPTNETCGDTRWKPQIFLVWSLNSNYIVHSQTLKWIQLQERLTVVLKMFANTFPFCTIIAVIRKMLMLALSNFSILAFKIDEKKCYNLMKTKKNLFHNDKIMYFAINDIICALVTGKHLSKENHKSLENLVLR